MLSRLFIIILLFFPLAAPLMAAGIDLTVIPVDPVRISGDIKQIFKDSEGYMWYVTSNTLSRDDGYDAKIFHIGKADKINNINEDHNGRMWISTDKGAYFIDKNGYTITLFDPGRIGSTLVRAVYVTDDGDIWISLYGSLKRYDAALGYKSEYPISDRSGKASYVTGFCQGNNGDILMTSYSRGVYRYDAHKDRFVMYRPINQDVPLGPIIKDNSQDYYWIYDFRGHIYRFSPNESNVFVSSFIRPYGYPTEHFENLLDMSQDDSNNYIWGVSRNHLLIFRPEKDGTLTPLDVPEANQFSGSMLTSLCPTKGAMHIGSLDRGASVVYFNDNNITYYSLPEVRGGNNTVPLINAVEPADNENMYWISQFRNGLLLDDIKTHRSIHHEEFPHLERLRLRMVEKMTPSHLYGGIWVSQDRSQGVHAIVQEGMKISVADSVIIDHMVHPTVEITVLYEDGNNRLWVGTTDGLYCFDLKTRVFTSNHSDAGYISDIAESTSHVIYALSKEKGLLEMAGSRYTVPASGREFTMGSALAVAPDGHIWIGTYDGNVYEFDHNKRETICHTSENKRLRQHGIKHISIGPDGRGWIVTEERVFEFSSKIGNMFIYKCDKDIPLRRILSQASMVESDGSIVLGGVGGIVRLRPNPLLDDSISNARTHISDILVNGESVINRLKTDDNQTEKAIRFKCDDKNIEFLFTSMDYRYASKIHFAYRVKNIDPEWQVTEIGTNRAHFNVLPRGNHILEVRAIDEYGRISPEVTELRIYREPHFYESWWAFTIYFIIVMTLIVSSLLYYRKRLRTKNEELWGDSREMIKMRTYLESPVTLPDEESQKLDKMLLEKATKAIEARLDDPDFDVNDLASAVNMSRSTLTRKLKSITGKTPLDLIRDIKMKHACSLLKSRNYSISQISDMLGFSDRRYFTASFRKAMGMSPRDYQTQQTQENTPDPEE